MAQVDRLRVALDDSPDALQLVTAEVHEATGLSAEVDFQEIDSPGELVVEVRLQTGGYTTSEITKMVKNGAAHLETLSAWSEPTERTAHQALRCQTFDLLQCEIPDLALRAHRDGVPTSRWHRASGTQTAHWLLAVPGIDKDRHAVVGVNRRNGYYYRFSASEARNTVLDPAH